MTPYKLSAAAIAAALLTSTSMGCAGSSAATSSPAQDAAPKEASADEASQQEAQADQTLPEVEIPYEKFTLDNGLTVLVHQDKKAPVVAVNVWYHVGSKDEKPGKTGFAHLFEHLMFQGSENYKGEYFEPLEKAGATDMNGTTNRDRTNYFQTVPKSALDVALWMESDRMGHFQGAISQERLDEQRGVVQNEKRQGENRPYGKAWRMIPENTYPQGHPYSWSTIGSMEDLDAASLEDVKSWFDEYYGASNAVLTLAGDISVEEAKEKAEKFFGHIPAGPAVPHRGPWIAKMDERKELDTYDQVPQARAYYVYNVPQYGSETTEHLRLAADLLGDGKNSRLYKRLVYEDQIATDVFVWLWEGEIGSQILMGADARPGVELAKVEKALEEEVARFAKEGPTEEELARVKMSNFAETVSGLEKVGGFGGKSDRLARGEVFLSDPGAFEKLLDVQRDATVEQVREATAEWMGDGVFVLRVYPDPNHKAAAKKSAADRSKVPEPGQAPKLDLPDLQRAKMSNGVEVVLAERHDVPMVRLRLMADGGYAADPKDKLGVAKLTMDVLDEGTENHSSLELAAELEKLGAGLSSGSSLETAYVSMRAMTTTLDPALDLFADVVLRPAFADEEIARRKKQLLASIDQETARPRTRALRLLGPLVYGDAHPYGVPLTGSGTKASVEALERDDLVAYHARQLRPENATILVVGDTTMEQIKPKLEERFGKWKAAEAKAQVQNGQIAKHDKVRVFLIDKPGAEQSLIATGNAFDERSGVDQLAVEAMNTVIGGAFSSRLNMNLREDKHWSYGARSFVYETKGKQLFGAWAGVQSDKTSESMVEIKKELDAYLGDKPITEAELAKTKQNKTRKLPGRNETTGRLLGSVAEIVKFELPDEYWDTYTDRMNELTVEGVRKTAGEVIAPERMTWIVIGDLDKIEEKVRALEFGEVIVLDEEGKPVN
ncbi:insulinase family protein [Persicimonas caeni]|uniref:Insulinase family protein n=1 Tax=Persicimonas caeni TaxID=2292766 RepID=A0A4Y6PRT5_PERCE|nr:pitrilysin family protein [Persicimonas caeni]QDG50819.1 insulinase family protein [Persicimonas caeni]QED32040.1 insulinase family protein [Persicimonas caeni]